MTDPKGKKFTFPTYATIFGLASEQAPEVAAQQDRHIKDALRTIGKELYDMTNREPRIFLDGKPVMIEPSKAFLDLNIDGRNRLVAEIRAMGWSASIITVGDRYKLELRPPSGAAQNE